MRVSSHGVVAKILDSDEVRVLGLLIGSYIHVRSNILGKWLIWIAPVLFYNKDAFIIK